VDEHYVLVGARITVELGTEAAPEVVRLSQFTEGPFLQSYVLMTDGGSILIDPVRPKPQEAQRPFLDRVGACQAIILITALHERNVYWFRERLGVPIYCPKQSVQTLEGSVDHAFEDGESLPGGIVPYWTGDTQEGDAVLLWMSPSGKRVLFVGDAINGQTQPGRFDGAVEPAWMRSGTIRLRLPGKVEAPGFEERFGRLRDLGVEWVLNGHNPRPIINAAIAINRVLDKGVHEYLEGGACSYLWTELDPIPH